MEEKGNQGQRVHKVTVTDRTKGTVCGVSDVLSFDVNEIVLLTSQGMLMIKGEELHVSRLTLEEGEVDIDGKIDSLTYSGQGRKKEKQGSLLGRLFQ